MYGRIMELPIEDMRRQMDVNYWGQVYGSRAAVRHLRGARRGADQRRRAPWPIAPFRCRRNYCAAKHALKAFTDAPAHGAGGGRRADLGDAGEAGQHRHAVLREGEDVPRRRAAAGAAGVCAGGRVRSDPSRGAAPRPRAHRRRLRCQDQCRAIRSAPRRPVHGALDVRLAEHRRRPSTGGRTTCTSPVADDGGERGRTWSGHTRSSSLYTRAFLHPRVAAAAALVGLAAGAALARVATSGRGRPG